MVKGSKMRLDKIQPSQLYISTTKLAEVMKVLDISNPDSIEPIPVKKLGNDIVFVDGHTRAYAAFLNGLSEIPIYWEDEELDWDEYEICVKWCKDECIHTIADLKNRVISHEDYKVLWLGRCAKMQHTLQKQKKQKQADT